MGEEQQYIPLSQLEAVVDKLVEKKMQEKFGTITERLPSVIASLLKGGEKQDNNSPTTTEWLNPQDASKVLGRSVRYLSKMVDEGVLRLKVQNVRLPEVRDIRLPGSARPSYQYHIERCQKRLTIPPEER